MLEYKPNMVLSNEEFDSIGSSPIRHDGADKVTGRARYGADNSMSGMTLSFSGYSDWNQRSCKKTLAGFGPFRSRSPCNRG